MDLISVIVPVYNAGKYLNRCINSILSQDYENLEIILVNDGSDDGSGELCDEFAKRDSRVMVVHQKNAGSSAARNAGIKLAAGKYIGFVDSDDYIVFNMYSRLYNACVSLKVKIAQIGRAEEDEKGNSLPAICVAPFGVTMIYSKEFMRDLLLHRGDCSLCTKLFERELFNNRRFPEHKLNEDFFLLIHMLTQIDKIASLPEIGYNVTYRANSNSHRSNKNEFSRVFADSVDNSDIAAKLVKKYFSGLEVIARRFCLFQRLEYLLHIPIAKMNTKNRQYVHCVIYIRKYWLSSMFNQYLTLKNKIYLTLFAINPIILKKAHYKWKSFRN